MNSSTMPWAKKAAAPIVAKKMKKGVMPPKAAMKMAGQ